MTITRYDLQSTLDPDKETKSQQNLSQGNDPQTSEEGKNTYYQPKERETMAHHCLKIDKGELESTVAEQRYRILLTIDLKYTVNKTVTNRQAPVSSLFLLTFWSQQKVNCLQSDIKTQ